MLHPDSQFEILRSLQEERLKEVMIARQLKAAASANKLSTRDRFLLASGEFLIAFGTRMKCQVSSRYCGPQPVEARHVAP